MEHMKKLLLVLITVFGSLFCSAQFNTYHPFPHTNASWCQTSEWLDPNYCPHGVNIITEYYDFYANGDTIVNSKPYIKIRFSGGSEFGNFCGGESFDSDHLECLIREDTLTKKVYISVAPNWGVDTLLYDFALTQGDYLPPSYVTYSFNDSTYVYSIDSILVGSSYRKQFIIAQYKSSPDKFDSIVEGVGSMDGLINAIIPPFEFYTWMKGFVNGRIIFPQGDSCSRFVLSTENIKATPTLRMECLI